MGYELRHRTGRKISPGNYYPLGATLADDGVNFCLYSQNAEEVYLLLFDRAGGYPTDVIRVESRTRFVWHVFVHGLASGQLYGYKVRGAYDPARGMRFNENKLLVDPYAKALTGKFEHRQPPPRLRTAVGIPGPVLRSKGERRHRPEVHRTR
jgi:glycogen operon protein